MKMEDSIEFGEIPDFILDDDNQKFTRYNALTLAERIAVIHEYDRTKKIPHLSNMFGCSKAQILFIIKHREEYESEWKKDANPQRIRRAISPHVLIIGIILFEYVWRLRHYPIEVNDENLKSVGKDIADMLGLKSFKSSKRWLERFKNCYRLDRSKLLTSAIIQDGKKKKSLQLIDVFTDIQNELKNKGIDILNLTDNCLSVLKAKRSIMVNNSLRTDPRHNKMEKKNRNLDIDRLIEIGKKMSNNNKNEKNKITDEPPVEYVEILSDIEDEDSNQTNSSQQQNSLKNYSIITTNNDNECDDSNDDYHDMNNDNQEQSNYETKELQNYTEALIHLKAIEEFAFGKEDLRAIGLINQLENYYKDKINAGEV